MKWFLSGRGFVFMFHRVLPEKERKRYEWNKELAITPDGIRKWVKLFRDLGFEFVSMDEVAERMRKGSNKKFVALTFDDGYKDNLIYGLPVLEELKVPSAIYVANCFPNNTTVYWWYFLEDYLKQNSEIDLRSIGINFHQNYTTDQASKVNERVRDLLRKSDYETHLKFAKEICGISNLDEINKELNLTWEEVKILNEHPLITIGGHTCNHVSLKNQKADIAQREIQYATKEIEEMINVKINHFAYPYGSLDDADPELFKPLKDQSYITSVLNHPGSVFSESKTNPYAIPRMGLSDETSEERLKSLFLGKVHLDFNGLNKSVL